MPQFPRTKNDTLILAAKIVLGINANAAGHPYPPFDSNPLNTQTNTLVEDWGVWKKTATDSEKTVINQPRGVEITYRATAVNTNGPRPGVTNEQVVL